MEKKDSKKKEKKASLKAKKSKYLEAVGRRKSSVVRARLWLGEKKPSQPILVNEKSYTEYFKGLEFQKILESPLEKVGLLKKVYITLKTKGGGIRGQAEAARLAIARVLVKSDEALKPVLKKEGFLTRDSRVVERKKYGLRKARRAQQWRKR